MGLRIYTEQNSDKPLSVSSDDSNPLRFTFDGTKSCALVKCLFLRNDDINKYYTSITIYPTSSGPYNLINGSYTWSWKLKSGILEPCAEEWLGISHGNTLSMSNIGSSTAADIATYYPFWVRVQSAQYHDVEAIVSISLDIAAKEWLVDV